MPAESMSRRRPSPTSSRRSRMRVTRSLPPPAKCPHMLSKPGSPEGPAASIFLYRSTCSRVAQASSVARSEEHTSELQSLRHLVCRLLLEKKKNIHKQYQTI